MIRSRYLAPIVLLWLLPSCGETEPAETAEDFAARVQGQQPSAGTSGELAREEAAIATPTPATTPAEEEDTGNTIGPQSASCGAPAAAGFVGRPLDDTTSKLIADAVPQGTRIRVIKPGRNLEAVPGSDRLNVMIDTDGIIRDLRCG